MPLDWTDKQKEAIYDRKNNLLVAAGAGSGKTAVLVERIIKIVIEEKIDIDRLLIVTFTRAAAGEMRERIAQAVLKEIGENNNSKEEVFLRRQLSLLNHAYISTLHSFCTGVIRQYFQVIDIDPGFRVAEAAETNLLKQEALEELFEEEYKQADDRFLSLVEMFGSSKDDRPLQEVLLRLYNFILNKPYPYKWLEEKVEDFKLDSGDLEDRCWISELKRQIAVELSGAKEAFERAYYTANLSGGPHQYTGVLQEDIELVDGLKQVMEKNFKSFLAELSGVKHGRLPRTKDVDESLKEEAKSFRDNGKDIIKKIREEICERDLEEYIDEQNEIYPYMDYLSDLAAKFGSYYKIKKEERNIVDFNDLEHYALEILSVSSVSEEYRQQFEYIFIDEYQDSNTIQEEIINFVKRENNLFLVGDVKQSIYRFRSSDPSLFLEKYDSFGSQENKDGCRIDLNLNFRSKKTIIDGVNYIFKNIMSRELGEIEYSGDALLQPGAEEEEEQSKIEVSIIEKNAEQAAGEIEDEIAELKDMEVEAKVIAKKINELVGQSIFDAKLKRWRTIEYRDIVVLLRSTKNWAQTCAETFLIENIPTYSDVDTGYFASVEVSIFINLLKVIDNMRQDIPLISVMRSPICSFTTEELSAIRLNLGPGYYFEAVMSYYESGEDVKVREKVSGFMERLKKWKKEARYIKIDEFIWKLLMETGFYYYCGSMPGGIQRQANLRILVDRAKQFQGTSIKGLFNFIKFVDQMKSSRSDFGAAKIVGEKDDVVRIMSIHKSKGLEFPVVIVGGAGKQFNLEDTNRSILFHKDLGIGPKYVDIKKRRCSSTLVRKAIQKRIKMENLSEEMRVLYVSCTRAGNRLFIIGSVRNIKDAVNKWNRTRGSFSLSKGRSYLDWIGPALCRHSDGWKLRKMVDTCLEEEISENTSRWEIEVLDRSDLQEDQARKKESRKELMEMFSDFTFSGSNYGYSGYKQEIYRWLNWVYDEAEAVRIPSKLSVTQVKNLKTYDLEGVSIDIPPLIARPKFMEKDRGFSSAEKGSVTHFVMQHIDFKQIGSEEEIKSQLHDLVEKELLTKEEGEVVNVKQIYNFYRSPIGERALGASQIYREMPFNLVERACDIIEDSTCEEEMLIQGVIDLYFMEDGEIVLVDYKTDAVEGENAEKEVLDRYSVQIMLYKKALEKILNKKVKESYLYLLSMDKALKVS